MSLKLNPDERIIREAALSFWLFQPSLLVLAVSLFGAVYFFGLDNDSPNRNIAMLACITVFAVVGVRLYIIFASTSLILTNRRVVFAKGFLHREVEELYLTRIEGMNIRQSLTARMLGYGTVEASGVGNEIAPMPGIANPWAFHKAVSDAMHEAMANEPAGPVAAGAPLRPAPKPVRKARA
jgi:membrane protein YdbS with pleckstrin-like domain